MILMLVWGPLVALGVILTISIFGSPFGIPLLLLTVPAFLVGWQLRRGASAPRWCAIWGLVAAVVLVAGVVWGVGTGVADDGFDVSHVLLVLFTGAWLWMAAGALVGALHA